VINASHPAATRAFLDGLGVDDDRLEIRPAPPARPRAAFDLGAVALDFYVRDMDAALARAGGYGRVTGQAAYDFRDRRLREARIIGPDRLSIVFIHTSHPRPSRLDRDKDTMVSELVGVVWAVAALEAAVEICTSRLGLESHSDSVISEPAVSAMLELPEHVAIRMALLGAPAEPLLRLELLEFVDRPGAATCATFLPTFEDGLTIVDVLDRELSGI
jgi:hypothetical protein